MAEVLIVVAIIGVLGALAAIMVINYQRSLRQLEYDGVAKEIFIAAQNHLTMADEQGLVEKRNPGNPSPLQGKEGHKDEENVFYYVVNYPDNQANDSNTVLNLMLPEFSVDETVRSGNYFIRYDKATTTVLDVFYSPKTGERFGQDYSEIPYATLMDNYRDTDNASRKRERRHYRPSGSILGYYGGESGEAEERIIFERPLIKIINAERLEVEVTNPNGTLISSKNIPINLKLFITGTGTDGKPKKVEVKLVNNAVDTSEKISYVLDDITSTDKHFKQRFPDLVPGCDLDVYAEISSNSVLANIATSETKRTNSLFADPGAGTNLASNTVGIRNIRHLENLEETVSGFNADVANKNYTARQFENLDWNTFTNKVGGSITDASGSQLTTNSYYPVSTSYKLTYEGNHQKVSNVKINVAENAGMFGTAGEVTEFKVQNLSLIDFSVQSTSASAGALAGSLKDSQVNNVVAYNTGASRSTNVQGSGSAGGLIGSMTGGRVEYSAAALTVSGGTAGGFIGSASNNASITACYSGGHTDHGAYYVYENGASNRAKPIYNVNGSGTAGGFVGSMSGSTVNQCYSTCSVSSNTTAGGFAGSASGTISNSYCTGLVHEAGESETDLTTYHNNAFLGSVMENGTVTSTNNQYFEIINEYKAGEDGYKYKGPGLDGVTALDASVESYNSFVGAPGAWTEAKPYDLTINGQYKGKYNLKSITRLGATGGGSSVSAKTHYGDWPSPETLVINQ